MTEGNDQSQASVGDRLEKTLASERVEAVQQAEIAALADILVKPESKEGEIGRAHV